MGEGFYYLIIVLQNREREYNFIKREIYSG